LFSLYMRPIKMVMRPSGGKGHGQDVSIVDGVAEADATAGPWSGLARQSIRTTDESLELAL
jgi:hypothetical protein